MVLCLWFCGALGWHSFFGTRDVVTASSHLFLLTATDDFLRSGVLQSGAPPAGSGWCCAAGALRSFFNFFAIEHLNGMCG